MPLGFLRSPLAELPPRFGHFQFLDRFSLDPRLSRPHEDRDLISTPAVGRIHSVHFFRKNSFEGRLRTQLMPSGERSTELNVAEKDTEAYE